MNVRRHHGGREARGEGAERSIAEEVLLEKVTPCARRCSPPPPVRASPGKSTGRSRSAVGVDRMLLFMQAPLPEVMSSLPVWSSQVVAASRSRANRT